MVSGKHPSGSWKHPLVSPHPKRSDSPTVPWLAALVVETLVSGTDDLQTKHVLRNSRVIRDVYIDLKSFANADSIVKTPIPI